MPQEEMTNILQIVMPIVLLVLISLIVYLIKQITRKILNLDFVILK